MQRRTLFSLCVAAAALASVAGCAQKQEPVSYQKDVVPILTKHCASCHVPGQPGYLASGFDMTGYESLMKGTKFGPVVLPGDPLTSTLVVLIEGRADPSLKMPHGGAQPLTEAEIKTIRSWVEQGARNN
jgi:uncharacterized membrane protein